MLAAVAPARAERAWQPAEPVASFYTTFPRVALDPSSNAFLAWGLTERFAERAPLGPVGSAQLADPDIANVIAGGEGFPRFEFDAAGNAVVAYMTHAKLQARYRPAGLGSTLGDQQTLGPILLDVGFSGGLHRFDVAVSPSGQALAAWVHEESSQILMVASRPAGADAQFDLAHAYSFPAATAIADPHVTLDPGGAAVVTWIENGTIMQATGSFAGPTFGAPTPLPQGTGIGAVQYGRNPNGASVLVWGISAGQASFIGLSKPGAAYRAPGGAFGTPAVLLSDGFFNGGWSGTGYQVAAVLDDGTAVVAWVGFQLTPQAGCGGSQNQRYVATGVFTASGSGGAWSDASILEQVDASSQTFRYLGGSYGNIALQATGNHAALTYPRQTVTTDVCGYGQPQSVVAVTRFSNGATFGAPTDVPGTAAPADIAIDADGNALLAWTSGTALSVSAFEDPDGTVTTTTVPGSSTTTTTLPGGGCATVADCESAVTATLPAPATATSRKARHVATNLGKLFKNAQAALARAANATGKKQVRQYKTARKLLGNLLAAAGKADQKSLLGVDLAALQGAVNALLATIPS